ncbi:MAG: orotidine-5'-phosphate decarboxylase [Smithellaceae bacterium]|nr:orotidine-5'-phosphate decarboxylase [Smithellaceae bacterium]
MKSISSNNPKDKLIFALDAAGYEEALSWIDLLSGHVGMFKIGKELFTSVGPKIIEIIKQRERRVFLDLKFHDIPNTVARAAEAAVALNVDIFNVHAAGGSRMMRETVDAVAACAGRRGIKSPVVLAVTVLTSLNNSDLLEIGFEKTTDELVMHLAKMAHLAGVTGVVASPRDIAAIRSACGKDFVIVTPGIRSTDEPVKDDQKRTLSAFEAIRAGADYVVVGRPIRNAPDPIAACCRIIDEITSGLASREST